MSEQDVAMRIAVASAFRDCGLPSDEQDVDDFLVALRSFGYVVERLVESRTDDEQITAKFFRLNVFRFAPESGPSIGALMRTRPQEGDDARRHCLLPPPALRERRHRGLARCRVSMRWLAILVLPER
jgi:hypothetical protein